MAEKWEIDKHTTVAGRDHTCTMMSRVPLQCNCKSGKSTVWAKQEEGQCTRGGATA
ncbi:LysR family transcriptional regulator [Sesbania bispinosa]|nr:LysR family transcriptional regulator [Sesbania bispinosa]